MRYDIWAAVKDPGEVAGMLPVIAELQKVGLSTLLFTNGWADGQKFEAATAVMCGLTAPEVFELDLPLPRLYLTGMAYGGGLGRDLIPKLRGKVPVVFLQSLWCMEPSYRSQTYRPDWAIVNDAYDCALLEQTWGLPVSNMFKTGYPALDKYATVDVAAASAKVRAVLGLDDARPLVLFAGQGVATAHALSEVASVLNRLAADCYFMPRPHPRMKEDYPREMLPWQRALARYEGKLVVDWCNQCTPTELVAAAAHHGVVVSMYSTMLLEAAALRGQAISVLYLDHGTQAMFDEQGHMEFPLVQLGCAADARDLVDLEAYLTDALSGRLGRRLRKAQQKHIRVDGQNAPRAAGVIKGLLA